MSKLTIPFDKKEIHYDPAKKEVSLPVEKFDALVKFMQGLVARVEEAEDEAGVANYQRQEAEASASVLQAAFERVKGQVREWLSSKHTIQELATRADIPYATCYRIVKERMEAGDNVDLGDFQKIEAVVSEDQKAAGDVVVVLPRRGKWQREEVVYRPVIQIALTAAGVMGMPEAEFQEKLQGGKLEVKLIDNTTGKSKPIEVQNFHNQVAQGAGRNANKYVGRMLFAQKFAKGHEMAEEQKKAKS